MDSNDLWFSLLDDISEHLPGGLSGFAIDYQNRSVREPVGCSVQQFAAAALLRSSVKKFQDEIDQEAADAEAIRVFNEANTSCENWAVKVSELGPYDETMLGEFKAAVYDFFHNNGYSLLDLPEIVRGVDFGPGASPGVENCSYLDKIGQEQLLAPNTITISLFNQWVEEHPLSVDVEITRLLLALGVPKVIESVPFTPVPKTSKISRLVRPEPLLGMFFQKGVQKVLEDQLQYHFGIDLSVQPELNARLAREGSLSFRYCTIDLKSASDYIALGLCDWCIPRASLNWLKAFRCGNARLPGSDSVVPLHMIATMGNAYCFPLQTALFACAVKAVYKTLGLSFEKSRVEPVFHTDPNSGEILWIERYRNLGTWGVFGDDIIVLEDAFGPLQRLLRALGFVPNRDKSFGGSDFFRESCGGDFYKGHNVRGVYCKSLKTPQDRYVLINSLVDWSVQHSLPLTKTVSMLVASVGRTEVPPFENEDSGIRMPLSCVQGNEVFRANRPPFDPKKPHYQGAYLYKRFVPRNVGWDVSDETRAENAGFWNSSAIFQAALKGALRGGRCVVRLWNTPYMKRVGVAPCWDYFGSGVKSVTYQERWIRFCEIYFGAK